MACGEDTFTPPGNFQFMVKGNSGVAAIFTLNTLSVTANLSSEMKITYRKKHCCRSISPGFPFRIATRFKVRASEQPQYTQAKMVRVHTFFNTLNSNLRMSR